MSLQRILIILCATTTLVLILTGGLLYYFIADSARALSLSGFEGTARGAAATMHGYTVQLTKIVDRFSNVSESFGVNATELDQVQVLADETTRFVPGLLRLRILPSTIEEPDKSQTPHMGYADLLMVRKAIESNPKIAVHGAGTPHAHIAIARKVSVGGKSVAVALGSYSIDDLKRTIRAINLSEGAFELKQGELSLGFSGDQTLKQFDPAGSVRVANTDWRIDFWMPNRGGPGPILFLAAILTAAMLLVLFYIYGFRWLIINLQKDQASIVNVSRDLLIGKAHGNYPIQIMELRSTVYMLTQMKRKVKELATRARQNGDIVEDEFEGSTSSLMDDFADVERRAARKRGNNVPPPQKTSLNRPASSISVSKNIFREYDIRGVVGDSLTEGVVAAIGQAFGSEALACGEQSVIVAYDGRLSSPTLSSALVQGLRATGCDVTDIGMVPTPVLYFATHFLQGNSGIMITGSHNPAEYNGLKMVMGGETLSGKNIQRLRERIENDEIVTGDGSYETQDLVPDYVSAISDDIQIGQQIKIVIDCGNGVSGQLAPMLFRSIGCEVVELYCKVDGNFPNHHPDPSKPENLEKLIETVKRESADIGLAFDGDGDRLGVVDSAGNIIWPDRQMMLFAADVLSRQPGADIIFDVKCSKHLATEIVKHGGRPVMWKTGHSLIKAKIKETGAQLAGEMSGHIFFGERWFGFDDALYSGTRLLEILTADPRTSAEIFAELPNSVNTPELNVKMKEGENFAFIDNLLAQAEFAHAKMTTIDGLRVDFPDGWGLVRASNTTPSLVLRFEAENQEALQKIQNQFRRLIHSVNPDLALPF